MSLVYCRMDRFLGHYRQLSRWSGSKYKSETASSPAAGTQIVALVKVDRDHVVVHKELEARTSLGPVIVTPVSTIAKTLLSRSPPPPQRLPRLPASFQQPQVIGTTSPTLFSAATGVLWSPQLCKTSVRTCSEAFHHFHCTSRPASYLITLCTVQAAAFCTTQPLLRSMQSCCCCQEALWATKRLSMFRTFE